MNMDMLKKYMGNMKVNLGIKIVVCMIIFITTMEAFFINGLNPYYTIREYSYENDFVSEEIVISEEKEIHQKFIARGNKITNISFFLNTLHSNKVEISLLDNCDKVIYSKEIEVDDFLLGSGNKVGFDCKIERGSEYKLKFYSQDGLASFILDMGERPETFLDCIIGQERVNSCMVMGVQQTYTYMTWASLFELFFSITMCLLSVFGLCYAVVVIEKLIETWKNEHSTKGILYAIYFAVTLVFCFNPLESKRIEVNSFNRVIGKGISENVDVARRISNFSQWFVYFVVTFTLFYLLINYYRQHKIRKGQEDIIDFLDQLVILGNVNLFLRCITYFMDATEMVTRFYYSTSVIGLLIIITIMYLVLDFDKKLDAASVLRLELMAFCVGYPVAIILQKEWQAGKLLFGIQATLMLATLIGTHFWGRKLNNKNINTATNICVITFSLLPFLTSFYIELINILNQHDVFVYKLRRYYIVMLAVLFLIMIAVLVYANRKKIIFEKWKTWSYTWIIFGLGCLQQQIHLEDIYDAEIYETANSSILISDFLNFGDIPIVQHYGGHMMTDVWEGLVYALLNNDFEGAVFSPYGGYVISVLAILFFWVIKGIVGEEIAFLTTLFFPFMDGWSYWGMGMVVCLAVWNYLKRNTYPRAALIWFAFIWSALYRLDIGFSIGLSCIITLMIYVIVYHNWKAAKQLLVTLLAWGVSGTAIWFVICMMKDINPINRLIEFLMISLSNQNWAYTSIGYYVNMLFPWCYIVVPFIIAGCLVFAILSKEFREKVEVEKWVLLLILGFSYFANFSRGLVRHSLLEETTHVVLWNAFMFIAIFWVLYKNSKEVFLPVFLGLVIISTAFTTKIIYNSSTLGDDAAAKVGEFTEQWTLDRFAHENLTKNEEGTIVYPETYWKKLANNEKKAIRVKWSDSLKEKIIPYEIVINTLLEGNETYVDFINKTFIYSAIGRKNPAYVSQSPLQLSGEFAQEMFIKEIKDVPIVLMPINNKGVENSLDGIENSYRYYKVAEYIYQNYVPLCQYESAFAVWCLADRYEELKEKAAMLANYPVSYIDYGYDYSPQIIENGGLHTYNVVHLANVWAENDDAIDNTSYCKLENTEDYFVFEPSKILSRIQGNYLLINTTFDGFDTGGNYYSDDEEIGAVIKIGIYEKGNFNEKYQYKIKLIEGKHNYLIRISSDYNWYLGDINAIKVECDSILYNTTMEILEGD